MPRLPLLACWASVVPPISPTQQMLMNLHKESWSKGLTLQDYSGHCQNNEKLVGEMLNFAKVYKTVR